jgi:hypothetical protein
VSFRIGGYKDEVLCYVVPSKIKIFELGHPWRHNRRAKNDPRNNTYSFSYENHQISILEEKVHQNQLFKSEIETKIFVEESETKISIEESYVIEEK